MDGDYMKDASKIWAMLDEMAENDPQKYRKFIDKHLNEGRQAMSPPEPHCVIQSNFENSLESLFINVCSWPRIPEPKSDEAPINIISSDVYNVDDSFGLSQVIAVCCSPGIIKRYGQSSKNGEEKEGFVMLIFQFLREMKKINLSHSHTVLNCLDLKGTPEELYSSLKFDPLGKNKELDDIAKTVIPDNSINSSGLLDKVNDFILKKETSGKDAESFAEEQHMKTLMTPKPREEPIKAKEKVLIEEIPKVFPYTISSREDAEHGKVVTVEITVDGVSSVKECDLVISKTDLRLSVKESNGSVEVKFPAEVDDANARAQFKKRKKMLLVTVPVR